jgi:hypothetical protein
LVPKKLIKITKSSNKGTLIKMPGAKQVKPNVMIIPKNPPIKRKAVKPVRAEPPTTRRRTRLQEVVQVPDNSSSSEDSSSDNDTI